MDGPRSTSGQPRVYQMDTKCIPIINKIMIKEIFKYIIGAMGVIVVIIMSVGYIAIYLVVAFAIIKWAFSSLF